LFQCTGKAEAVQQAKRKSDDPRIPFSQPRLALSAVENFRRNESDTQGDGCFKKRSRSIIDAAPWNLVP